MACELILANISCLVSGNMNEELFRPFLNEEIKIELFQMLPTKALGLDRICNGVRSLLSSGFMLRKINFTHVTFTKCIYSWKINLRQ